MKVIGLLVCLLFALAAADSASISLDVFTGSNPWFLAIAVRDAGVETQSVQIKQASSSTWETMNFVTGWGYYTFNVETGVELSFPVSVRINSVEGHQLTIPSIIASASAGLVDTNAQYASAAPETDVPTDTPADAPTDTTDVPTEDAPDANLASTRRPNNNKNKNKHKRPTSAPATSKPTKAPTTKAPTTKAPATSAPTTKAPATKAPTTKAPTTKAPTTKAPATSAPSTKAPTTKAPTNPPVVPSSSGMKLMVPLYTYPGATWDTVAAGARVVPTLAIINPNSGPGNGPDSSYNSYMSKLHNAGVDMVGYVHTSYGARSISDVKADINVYASQFPLLVGIFLDEVATASSKLSYYQELYSYIMGMPGWKYDILNPGTVPDAGYVNAATQIVTYESSASGFANSQNPSYATASTKDKYAMITYGASTSSMQTAISAAKTKGYYGWVYVTNTAGTGATYNSLPSFYADEAAYIASLN